MTLAAAIAPFWLVVAAAFALAAWRAPIGSIPRILLGAASIAAMLVGFDIVHLPSIEEVVTEIGTRLGAWTYLLVGVNAFLETGAFLGFLVPGETMVLFGGVLAGEGTIDLVPLILVVWLSALAGDVCAYLIGRRYGRDFLLRHGARFRVGESEIEVVERFFARHGDLTVLLGRWVGVVRPLVPFMAGSSRLGFTRFIVVDIFATLIWAVVLCVLGALFWRNFDQLTSIVGRTLLAFGTLIVVVAVLVGGVSLRRSPARAAAIDRWLAERRDGGNLLARPLGILWALIGRIDQQLRGARGATPAGTATVDAGRADRPPDDSTQ